MSKTRTTRFYLDFILGPAWRIGKYLNWLHRGKFCLGSNLVTGLVSKKT